MVNFHQRIRKLEKTWDRPRVCNVCGAGDRIPRRVVGLGMYGFLRDCAGCGGLVAEDGWPVGVPRITVKPGQPRFVRSHQ